MSATPSPLPQSLLSTLTSTSTIRLSILGAVSAVALRLVLRLLNNNNKTTTSPQQSSMSNDTATTDKPITQSQLANARDDPLYIAVKDPFGDKISVFDVTSGRDFYGPGCGYHLFTGRDATYGLATTSIDPAKQDGDITTLTASQKDTHIQWYQKYASKYPIVGYLVPDNHEKLSNEVQNHLQDTKKDA